MSRSSTSPASRRFACSWSSGTVSSQRTGARPDDLAERFRNLFLRGIERLYRRGELVLPAGMSAITDRDALRAWLEPLRCKRWMVDCQGPPVDCQDTEAVLKYLAKYVAGSVIHDYRIVSDDGEWVTFSAKNYRDGTRELIRIRGVEFVRRFCLHFLPRGFHRSRNYGLFAARKRKQALPLCRQLLGVAEPEPVDTDDDAPRLEDEDRELSDDKPRKRCPRCLLWAMVWMHRMAVTEMVALQSQERRLGELLLSTVTTLDVDRSDTLRQWQREANELAWWPLPFW